jgi:hypothetical protein
MEATMAKESDLHTRGILGDINPVPAARDHIAGPGVEDSDEDAQHPGSRDVSQRTTGNAGTEVGGTRNYRTGTGATGGDIGNRPE